MENTEVLFISGLWATISALVTTTAVSILLIRMKSADAGDMAVFGFLAFLGVALSKLITLKEIQLKGTEMQGWYQISALFNMTWLLPLSVLIFFICRWLSTRIRTKLYKS